MHLVQNYVGLLACHLNNKLASLVATLVRNYDPLTHLLTYSLTGVKCRATSVAKNGVFRMLLSENTFLGHWETLARINFTRTQLRFNQNRGSSIKTLPEAQRTQKLTPRLGLNLATTWRHLH